MSADYFRAWVRVFRSTKLLTLMNLLIDDNELAIVVKYLCIIFYKILTSFIIIHLF